MNLHVELGLVRKVLGVDEPPASCLDAAEQHIVVCVEHATHARLVRVGVRTRVRVGVGVGVRVGVRVRVGANHNA